MVAITLHVPTYPAEEWIRSPLYESREEGQFYMPWSFDVPGPFLGRLYVFDLKYFSHVCKIRRIQSDILCKTQSLPPDKIEEYTRNTREEIDEWARADKVLAYGYVSTHEMVLWLTQSTAKKIPAGIQAHLDSFILETLPVLCSIAQSQLMHRHQSQTNCSRHVANYA